MRYLLTIMDQTNRSLWSLENVMHCVPSDDWDREYCGMPFYKHIYHTLHSLDRWYINPECYQEPGFHMEGLNSLDTITHMVLDREALFAYAGEVFRKIRGYLGDLKEEDLLSAPPGCPHTRFHLILAQHRHLDMHIGMLMGFLIRDTGKWPAVMGLEHTEHDFSQDFPFYDAKDGQ